MKLLVGNEHTSGAAGGHRVLLFVRSAAGAGDDSALAAVEKVTFVLHEATFHKPIVVRRAPALFECAFRCWGFFEVRIAVAFSDGRPTLHTKHTIDFCDGVAEELVDVPDPPAAPLPLLAPGALSSAKEPAPAAPAWAKQHARLRAATASRWEAAGEGAEQAADAWAWHGSLADPSWPPPRVVCAADGVEARPGYDSCSASEFLDSPEVLEAKVDLLARLVRQSRAMAAYTGAGISTAAGIGDYASRGAGTMAKRWGSGGGKKPNLRALKPTLAHRVLAALARDDARRAGDDSAPPLKAWVQQNHDGLAFKAACPPHIVNEIHGSWFDRHNGVVKMDGSLRPDLCERMEATAAAADLVLALGTSLCGLFADQVATEPAARARRAEHGALGLVVINLQKTQQDRVKGGGSPVVPNTALRIFATLDVALGMLARKLELRLPAATELERAQRDPVAWYADLYDKRNATTTRETNAEMRVRCAYRD